MCKYCKHLQEVRNLERKSYERVVAHLKKELKKDDYLFYYIKRHLEINAFYTQYLVGVIDKKIGKEGDEDA